MDSLTIFAAAFACSFGGALCGLFLRRVLPDSHLTAESKDVVTMCMGLLATLVALVLGVLIGSAKTSYDVQRSGYEQLSSNIVLLDNALRLYGPEANDCRAALARTVRLALAYRWPANGPVAAGLNAPEITASGHEFYVAVQALRPTTDAAKSIQAQALQSAVDLGRTRLLLGVEDEGSLPAAFLIVLIGWLAVLFFSFGLFSPTNATVLGMLFVCALSLAGALFLMIELDRPFDGLIRISDRPLKAALVRIEA